MTLLQTIKTEDLTIRYHFQYDTQHNPTLPNTAQHNTARTKLVIEGGVIKSDSQLGMSFRGNVPRRGMLGGAMLLGQ